MKSTQSQNRVRLVWPIGVALLVGATVVWAIGPWSGARGRSVHSASDIVPEDRPELAIGRSAEFDYDPPAPGSYTLPAIQDAGDGEVIGPDGRPQRLAGLLEGKINVLSFIYTRCADPAACPRASGMLREIHRLSRQDHVLADSARLITLSFDPAHDTPDVIGRYGRGIHAQRGGAEWRFLTTRGPEELKPILEQYGQLVERKGKPDIYGPLYHTVRVYLIDRVGRIRNIYSMGLLDPRLVVTDIRTLLLEEIASQKGGSSDAS